jgi:hypothetical protein
MGADRSRDDARKLVRLVLGAAVFGPAQQRVCRGFGCHGIALFFLFRCLASLNQSLLHKGHFLLLCLARLKCSLDEGRSTRPAKVIWLTLLPRDLFLRRVYHGHYASAGGGAGRADEDCAAGMYFIRYRQSSIVGGVKRTRAPNAVL